MSHVSYMLNMNISSCDFLNLNPDTTSERCKLILHLKIPCCPQTENAEKGFRLFSLYKRLLISAETKHSLQLRHKNKRMQKVSFRATCTFVLDLSLICPTTGFLAYLVMSLCIILCPLCVCRPCHQHWCWHHSCHLCTALPVIALIIETLCLGNICIYTPSICI